jgi:hypothetical protein
VVRQLAARENISINQFITLAVAEKISALMTEDYLVKRGSREKFEAAMAKVAEVEPEEKQRLSRLKVAFCSPME